MRKKCRPLPFVLAATEQGTLIVNHKDYHVVDSNRTHGVGFQLLNSATFDYDEVKMALMLLDWLRESRGDGIFAIDCGANIGVHTIEWARHMSGWGEVLAYEAQERIYYALAGNICLNNCFNSRAVLAAVGDQSCTIMVPGLDYNTPSNFGGFGFNSGGKSEDIGQAIDNSEGLKSALNVIRLDDQNFDRVDLIKVDVEGMELDVLIGSIDTISRLKPYLIVEHIKVGVDPIKCLLESLGYKVWTIGINLLCLPEVDPFTSRINIFENLDSLA